MKKCYLLLLVTIQLLLATHTGYAQVDNPCGFDTILNIQQQIHPDFNNRIIGINDAINNYINNNNSILSISPGAEYVIPVVVHIVRDPSDPIISYAQVQSQIDALNAAFAIGYPAYNAQQHGPYATDTKIQFCLAGKAMGPPNWTNASESGVMRYTDAVRANNFISIASTNDLLENLTHPGLISTGSSAHFPFDNYLNIWVVKSINGSSVLGYSVLPLAPQVGQNGFVIDGVVIRADVFGDNSVAPNNFPLQPVRNQGKVLAHEVGHYLNLFHTFQNDIYTTATCAGSNLSSCNNEGDFCCDTPPSNTGGLSIYNCSGIRQTCNETYAPYQANYSVSTVNPNDQTENYMYYSHDPCWNTFTKDQSDRMEAFLNLFRPTLTSLENLVATEIIGQTACIPAGLFPQFSYSGNACINQSLIFEPIVPSPANTAINYNWSFTGGSPTSSTLQNPTVTYATPGNYTATLTVDDGVNPAVSYSLVVAVSACQLNPDYINNANWFYGQYAAVDFTSGIPTTTNIALTNQTVFTLEGSYSYSDNNGNLVFYTDATNVWNNQHQQINTAPIFSTSAATYNNVTNLTQTMNSVFGIIGVPFPDNPNKFILFCAPANEDLSINYYVRYTILDLNTNTLSPVQFLTTGVPMTQGLTIIPHCNGKDYWLISKSRVPNNDFYVYLISGLGLNTNPITSLGFLFRTASVCEFKGSPDNQKIVITGPLSGNSTSQDIAVYNFDNATGIILSETIFDAPGYSGFRGCSFSPGSNSIYATCGTPIAVIQFDLIGNVINSIFVNNSPTFLQIGPENNLYVGYIQTTVPPFFTGVITNPNNIGVLTANAIDFSSQFGNQVKTWFGSLPNFIDGIQPPYTLPTISATNPSCTEYAFSISCWGGYTHTWNFGDGSPLITGNPVSHTYAAPGTYIVTCTLTIPGGAGNITIQHNVFIPGASLAIAGPVVVVCQNSTPPNTYSVPSIQGATYNWSVSSNGAIIGVSTGSQIDVQFNSGTSGTVSVTIVDNNCTSSGTLSVNISQPAAPVITGFANTCSGLTTYTLSNCVPGLDYTWNVTGGTLQSQSTCSADILWASTGGTVTVTVCNMTSAPFIVEPCCVVPGATILLNNTDVLSYFAGNPQQFVNPADIIVINGDFIVNGNLLVDMQQIYLGPDAKIIIEPGFTLTITRVSMLEAGCNKMWDGIYIEDNTASLIINGQSTLKDAKNAVVSKLGGSFLISEAILDRNFKHLVVKPYPGNHTASIVSSQLICPGGNSLIFPHVGKRTRIGVEVTNVNDIFIGGANATNNSFDNMDFGITALESNITIKNNSFENITTPSIVKGGPCPVGTAICITGDVSNSVNYNATVGGIGSGEQNSIQNGGKGIVLHRNMNGNIINNTINNLSSIGIYVERCEFNKVILIDENIINDVRVGIYAYRNPFAFITISFNAINLQNKPYGYGIIAYEVVPFQQTGWYIINRNDIKNARKGIETANLFSPQVEFNKIKIAPPGSYSSADGINMANAYQPVITSNAVNSTSTDWRINGIRVDMSDQSYIYCNSITTTGQSLFCGGAMSFATIKNNSFFNSRVGFFLNWGLVGPQGVVGAPNDNRWFGNFPDGHTYAYFSNGTNSPFFVRNQTGPFNPANMVNDFNTGGMSFPIPINPTNTKQKFACPKSSFTIDPGPRKPTALKIVRDSINFPAYIPENKWISKMGVYKLLQEDTSLVSQEQDLLLFNDSASLSNMGTLDNIRKKIGNPVLMDQPAIVQQAKVDNDALVPANLVESHQKEVNDIFLVERLSGIDSLTQQQIDDLRVIANKCPYFDGVSVYMARVLLAVVDSIGTDYLNICEYEGLIPENRSLSGNEEETGTNVSMAIDSKETILKLYPNPAREELTLEYNLSEGEKGYMEIVGLIGNKTIRYELNYDSDRLEIPTAKLDAGIYLYKIVINNELVRVDKLVIIK